MKNASLRVPLAALPLAILASFASHAQNIVSDDLPETVVTATRFAEPAASLPIGVSVITADQIRASGASTVNEAVMRLLGVPGRLDFYGGSNYTLDLRGFGETANSNQVIILDGVRISEADSGVARLDAIPIDSVQRIEVMRGNASVLYGEGAVGGVIVISTKAGSGHGRTNQAHLYVGAGTHNMRDTRASATLSAGGFSVDVHAQDRTSDNHRENSRASTRASGFTGQWSNDFIRLGLRYSEEDQRSGLPGSLSAEEYISNPWKSDGYGSKSRFQSNFTGAFAEWSVNNWNFAADAGQRNKELSDYGAYEIDADTFSIRARQEQIFRDIKNIAVLGYDDNRWARKSEDGYFDFDDRFKSKGFYFKDDLIFANGIRLSVGARTEKMQKSVNPKYMTFISDRMNAWDFGVNYPVYSGVSVWSRFGKGFRLANADEMGLWLPSADIRPQTSRDLEAGARWAEGAYKLEARLYRSNLKDEIGYDPTVINPNAWFSNGFGANVNFDPTRRQGLELDGDWQLSKTVALGARLAFRSATFREGANVGKHVPLTPRQSLALRADWKPLEGHRLSGGVNFVGTQHPDFANVCRMPSHTTADARYAFQMKNAELSFGVNNLFDRRFYAYAFGCDNGQINGIYPEAGRTFTAALRMSF
jgi:iron complex outermembrane recepter protein